MTDWSSRYLNLLGLERPAAPSLDWLWRFGSAHLQAVPFCNVTSILRRAAAPGDTVPAFDAGEQLDAWERRTGGGVCFEVAPMVSKLLDAIGFQCHLVLGDISFPGSHEAVVVRLREGPYLVDLGCGEPLPEPVPLIRPSEYRVAGLSYRFRPDLASMSCAQDRLIDGEWTEFCRYHLQPSTEEERDAGYQRHHTPGETWVLGGITLMRFFEAESEVIALRGGRMTRYRDHGKQATELPDDAAYERHLRNDLRWPELPIVEALTAQRWLQRPGEAAPP